MTLLLHLRLVSLKAFIVFVGRMNSISRGTAAPGKTMTRKFIQESAILGGDNLGVGEKRALAFRVGAGRINNTAMTFHCIREYYNSCFLAMRKICCTYFSLTLRGKLYILLDCWDLPASWSNTGPRSKSLGSMYSMNFFSFPS
jgi:hypothetical protein